MIDTDKYEGHAYSDPSWKWAGNRLHSWVSPEPLVMRLENEWEGDEATMQLIADAPILLQEVKRLREAISDIARCMDAADPVYLQGFIKDLYEVIE